jgi:DNA-binding transcriptional MerR regulator
LVDEATGSPKANGQTPRLRIGALGRRVGVRPETLRAWERRYALLEPARTSSGYRLYSDADEERVRAMLGWLARGVSAAEAAKLAREHPQLAERTGSGAPEAGPTAPQDRAPEVAGAPKEAGAGAHAPAPADPPVLASAVSGLVAALEGFDDEAAHAILDRFLARLSLATVLAELVLPALDEVGDRWARGEVTIAQEHFCSELLRGRLLALARGWGGGGGPLALLACPPHERHDLGLVAFGLVLRERGWRVAFLGADTPTETLGDAAERLQPDAVVVAAVEPARFEQARAALRDLAERCPLLVAGAGANPEVARAMGAAHLAGAPVDAAGWLAEQAATRPVAAT